MSGLTIRDLTVTMGTGQRARQIITGIDLDVPAGRITGLAGESGSGKTMTGLAALGLLPRAAVPPGASSTAGGTCSTCAGAS